MVTPHHYNQLIYGPENISKYGWKHDYVKQREAIVRSITIDRINELPGKYLDANKMI